MVAKRGIIRTGFMTEIDQFLRDYDKNRKNVPDSVRKEMEKSRKVAMKRDNVVEETLNPILKDF